MFRNRHRVYHFGKAPYLRLLTHWDAPFNPEVVPEFKNSIPKKPDANIHPRSIGQHGRVRRWFYAKPEKTTDGNPKQIVFDFMNTTQTDGKNRHES